jgi:alpha-amylase/alpha-mannosidase (GH57 family)
MTGTAVERRSATRRNTAARRVAQDSCIIDIVNSFEKISFNVGPTLLSWLDRHAPHVYQSILRPTVAGWAHGGHGNAIAQFYNHMILPLASRRDKVTQVCGDGRISRSDSGSTPRECGCRRPQSTTNRSGFSLMRE